MKNKVDINKSNYEIFVIDYLDGKLSAVEVEHFMAFLEDNPDIKEELVGIKETTLETENIFFTQKSELKKKELIVTNGIDENNYENYFIGYYENELTPSQNSSLKNFLIENQELNGEFKIYGSLKLIPDYNVVFTDKTQLKRKHSLLPVWYSSAAAIVILFVSFWYLSILKTDSYRIDSTSINQIELKSNSNNYLTINKVDIKLTDRKLVVINSNEITEYLETKDTILLSNIKSKIDFEPLVNGYEYGRLLSKNINNKHINPTGFDNQQPNIVSDENTKKKSLFANVFNNQFQRLASAFKSNKKNNNNSSPDPTYVKVLDRGILVFNTITGSETYTSKTYNFNGELTSYQIEGQEVLLRRSTSVKSSE